MRTGRKQGIVKENCYAACIHIHDQWKNCTITAYYAVTDDQKINEREEINATPKDRAEIIRNYI